MTSSEHGACILAPIQLWESFTFQPRLVVCELRNYQRLCRWSSFTVHAETTWGEIGMKRDYEFFS